MYFDPERSRNGPQQREGFGMGETIFVGGGGEAYGVPQNLLLKYGNRHGLIAGATGTGKTVTLQVLAEGFSAEGVPVFMADVKGDLSGIAAAGSEAGKLHEAFQKRSATIGYRLAYSAFPVTFWDMFGVQGHPIRATVAEMGPLLLSRLLELTEPQEGVLNVAFRLADEEQLALLDLKDLQALLTYVAEHQAEISARYGLVSTTSVGAIQRRLLVLENQGATQMFGEPALDLADLMRCDANGMGMINVLAAETYRPNPRFAIEDAIRDVGTGEAVTSFLEAKGIPGVAERTLVRPPASQLGPIDPALRAQIMSASPMGAKYNKTVDRDSAYELLRARAEHAAAEANAAEPENQQQTDQAAPEFHNARRYDGGNAGRSAPAAPKKTTASRSDSIGETFAKSFARSLGSKTGQAVIRGVLGSLFRSR